LRKVVFEVVVVLFLVSCFCFGQESSKEFDWSDLVPCHQITENQWNDLVLHYGKEIKGVSANCGSKKMGIWYLENEPEYVVQKTEGSIKRAVFLVQTGKGFYKALCFDTCNPVTKKTVFSNPYVCGVQGYDADGQVSLITAARNMEDFVITELGDYRILFGAYEWSFSAIETGGPFYFWDSTKNKVICANIEKGTLKTVKVNVTNPTFYYGTEFESMGLERNLLVVSVDEASGNPIKEFCYELKDGKGKKVE